MNRKIKFVIIENLCKGYENGKYTDLAFLYLIFQCIIGHRDKEEIEY